MSGHARVDYGSAWLDLRAVIAERPSWGARALRERLDQLEQHHRLPLSATADPLALTDRPAATVAAMDSGAGLRSPHQTETPR